MWRKPQGTSAVDEKPARHCVPHSRINKRESGSFLLVTHTHTERSCVGKREAGVIARVWVARRSFTSPDTLDFSGLSPPHRPPSLSLSGFLRRCRLIRCASVPAGDRMRLQSHADTKSPIRCLCLFLTRNVWFRFARSSRNAFQWRKHDVTTANRRLSKPTSATYLCVCTNLTPRASFSDGGAVGRWRGRVAPSPRQRQ